MKVKCDWCGKTKLIYNWELKLKHHFCNLKCYGKWNSKNRIKEKHPRYLKRIKTKCDNCRKAYIKPPWYLISNNVHHFCGRKCFHEWYKKNIRGENSPSWKGGEKEISCFNCKRLFSVPRCSLKGKKHLFCSKKCVDEWSSKHRRGKNHPRFKERIEVDCDNCGKKLHISECDFKLYKHHFCGTKCFHLWWKKYKVGKNCPTYIHGQGNEPYTLEFNKQLKEQIRKRDHYKCQHPNCKITQKKSLVKWNEKLHIHHTDYDGSHANSKRLIALCKNCNSRVNSNRDYWFAYFMYILEEKYNG